MAADVNVRLCDLPYMRAKLAAFNVERTPGFEIT